MPRFEPPTEQHPEDRDHSERGPALSPWLSVAILCIAGAASIFWSGSAAVHGARASGLPESRWSFELFLLSFLGWTVGFLITPIAAAVVCRMTKALLLRISVTLTVAPALSFCTSLLLHLAVRIGNSLS